jgi:hypothetical protein
MMNKMLSAALKTWVKVEAGPESGAYQTQLLG